MRDQLIDLMQHTQSLGFIDILKINGASIATKGVTLAADKSVVVYVDFKEAIAEFEGTFGMPNLPKLNTILNLPVYDKDTNITVTRRGTTPVSINFENAKGDFKNEYRLQAESVINDRVPDVKFSNVTWGVTINPTKAAVQRMKYQASANSEETVFVVKTNADNTLEFMFGDPSTHAGNFVFAENITGTLAKQWAWPISQTVAILSLPGDITMSFSDHGACQIIVDSGIAKYTYILPAQSK